MNKVLKEELMLDWKCVQRWWQVDPMAHKFVGFNTYNYVLNNPIKMIDPTGMLATEVEDNGGGTSGKTNYSIIGGSKAPVAMRYWDAVGGTNMAGEFKLNSIAASLKEALTIGSKSELFKNLLEVNAINENNVGSIITISDGDMEMIPETGKINIKPGSIEQMIQDLTHELTNRMFRGIISDAKEAVSNGEISPEEFASKWLEVEAFGIANTIVVNAELNFSGENQQAIDAVKNGNMTRGQVVDVAKRAMKSGMSRNTGQNIYQRYIEKGQFYRQRRINLDNSGG